MIELAPPGDLTWWTSFGISDILTGMVSAGVALVVGWFVLRGKLAETEQSRESSIWVASKELREDLYERVKSLETDREKMKEEITDLHEARVNDAYVRAYARMLVDVFPDPPGPPEAPLIVAKVLGLLDEALQDDQPMPNDPAPRIRDSTGTE